MIELFIFLCGGIFIGFVSGFFGVGGGTITVPFMIVMGLSIKQAIAVSSMQMCAGSLLGTFLHLRQKTFEMNELVFLGMGGISGAIFGTYGVAFFPHRLLEYLFLLLILLTFLKLFFSSTEPKRSENHNPWVHLFIGFFIGIFSGLLGVGGAILLTPILVSFLGYHLKKAIAMSLFFVLFTSIGSFISFWHIGLVPFQIGTFLALSSLGGIYAGIHISKKISTPYHKKLLMALYIMIFVTMASKVL